MLVLLPLLVALVALVHAQTLTVVNPLGQTVVEVITINPLNELPSTTTIQTLVAGQLTTTTPLVDQPVTTTTQQLGPVGQPATTTAVAGGPTPYTYTTVINSVTQAIVATFTPTNPATTPFTPTVTGTVLDYSSWLSIYGAQTTSAKNAASAFHQPPWAYLFFSALAAVVGGGWLML